MGHCTEGDEVIIVSDNTVALAGSNVQAGPITVDVGVCYNQIALEITDEQAATLYQMAVYDDVGGVPTNLIAETVATFVPAVGFVYEDIPEFTTTTSTIWLAYQSNANVVVGIIFGAARQRDPNTFGSMPDPFSAIAAGSTPAMKIKHDGTGHDEGLTLSGTHATIAFAKKKKKKQPLSVIGPRAEQLIPVEFTYLAKGVLVRNPIETIKLKSTLIREASVKLDLKSALTRTVKDKVNIAGNLLAKIGYLVRLEANTLKNYTARTGKIKQFLLHKLDEITTNDDK